MKIVSWNVRGSGDASRKSQIRRDLGVLSAN